MKKRARTPSVKTCELAKRVWLVGQDLENYEDVLSQPWDFSHMLPSIESELEKNQNLCAYVFGSTEPQQFNIQNGSKSEIKVIPVPVMVAVLSEVAPPSLVGITSIQSSKEKIVDMRELKMSWYSWRPDIRQRRDRTRTRATHSRIFVLDCTLRNYGRGPYIREERRKLFEYALPYILREQDVPDEPRPVTHVTAEYTSRLSKKRIEFVFDKEIDRTVTFIPDLIEVEKLEEDEFDDIKEALKSAFKLKRAEEACRLAELRATIEKRSDKERIAMEALQTRKYYPKSEIVGDQIDRFKTNFINRYYGRANSVH
eukprot:CAMPEP_0185772318 /NCGR_PEP_ID=MMETSP1174-20130828/68311_1 /TAXON_ID=35687 /ORGANISM="Dictyocha speculum, Strain CCMP1381" /LENGTH=312 /DNA_ID=CAMNT_0028458521 /DNA_START=20 /DNA_END=958 /DNA_ORIENTATION=+